MNDDSTAEPDNFKSFDRRVYQSILATVVTLTSRSTTHARQAVRGCANW